MHSISVLAVFLIMAPTKPVEVAGPYTHGKLAVYPSGGMEFSLNEAMVSGAAPALDDVKRFLAEGDSVRTELISKTMERRSSENVDAAIFEYRVRGDKGPLHSSYVKKK
ncbi:MAG: hypothetical protein BMS9Abin37_0538 [Acidobacteriota bacterium]|nr:MAG: hypothetical protein BMS9Abin37_0538 [Acidobacteriota bacterium]